MSTKTTFKRVALVAVAALGFGVLTSVAPASAEAATGITALTPGPTRVGQATTVRFAITHAVAASDTMVVTATITSKPVLSSASIVDLANGAASGPTLTRLGATYANATIADGASGSANANATISTGTASLVNNATTSYVDVVVTPDIAGTYVLLLSAGNTTYQAGDKNAVVTLTTVGAPATATMSVIGSQIATGGSNGSLIKVTLKDANGAATKPAAFESIDLTVSTGSAKFTTLSSGPSTISLGHSGFESGTAYVRITDAVAADTVVVSSAGGGVLGSTTTLASTVALTSSKASGTAAASAADWQQGTGVATTGFDLVSQASLVFPSTATSQSIGLSPLTANGTATETTAAATLYTTVTVTDTTGAVTGKEGHAYDVVLSQAGGGATKTSALSVTATLGTTHSYVVTTTLTGGTSLTVSGAAASAATAVTGAISPAVINSALGGTNTFTAQIKDRFGVALANAAVQATVTAGRNLGKTAALASNADGFVTFTLTDTGTTGLSDTITFDGPTDVTATITYGVAVVSTATLTGGNTTAGVTATTVVPKDISAGDGAELGAQTFTVTVKDANGALLAGLPVAWTVSGTTAAIMSTDVASYTSSTGTSTADVYAWVAGTYTVTATVGGVAATGTITFAQLASGEERTITVAAEGPVVTATVVDRFGNAVPGVTVYATKTGIGYFGAGVTKTSGTTATDGTVEFVIAGGSADVTVSTINYSAAAGTFGSGQTSAPKGYLGNSTTAAGLAALELTAYTAGTATIAEEGVGASFDAAGVASATVTVTNTSASDASDAAAEATDAANAATDAANAAAEAADAATAAAQDAADAVAALSTEVAATLKALKKQITALTNLVIKIQKKVRA